MRTLKTGERDLRTVLLAMRSLLGDGGRFTPTIDSMLHSLPYKDPHVAWSWVSTQVEATFPEPHKLTWRERAAVTVFSQRDFMGAE